MYKYVENKLKCLIGISIIIILQCIKKKYKYTFLVARKFMNLCYLEFMLFVYLYVIKNIHLIKLLLVGILVNII